MPKKKGLRELLELIVDDSVGRLVLTHKDRLLRFRAELMFAICEAKNVEIVIINQADDRSFEEKLASDVLEIVPRVLRTHVRGKVLQERETDRRGWEGGHRC